MRDTAKASVAEVTCGLTDGFEQLFLSPSSRPTITALSSALINCCPHFQPPAGKVEPVGDWGGTEDWSGKQCHKPLARRQSLGNTTDFDSLCVCLCVCNIVTTQQSHTSVLFKPLRHLHLESWFQRQPVTDVCYILLTEMNYLQSLAAKSLESLLNRENVTKPNAIIISVSHLRCWEIICLMMLAAWSQTPLTRNYNSALSQDLLVLIRKLNKASKTYYCHLCCGRGKIRLNASLVSKVKNKQTKKTNNLPSADRF